MNNKPTIQTLIIVWAALIASIFVYIVIGVVFIDSFKSSYNPSLLQILRPALIVVAVVTLAGTLIFRKIFLRANRKKKYESPSDAELPTIQKYSSTMIISLVMAETVAIYGLILTMIGQNKIDVVVFSAVAIVTMIRFRPKSSDFRTD